MVGLVMVGQNPPRSKNFALSAPCELRLRQMPLPLVRALCSALVVAPDHSSEQHSDSSPPSRTRLPRLWQDGRMLWWYWRGTWSPTRALAPPPPGRRISPPIAGFQSAKTWSSSSHPLVTVRAGLELLPVRCGLRYPSLPRLPPPPLPHCSAGPASPSPLPACKKPARCSPKASAIVFLRVCCWRGSRNRSRKIGRGLRLSSPRYYYLSISFGGFYSLFFIFYLPKVSQSIRCSLLPSPLAATPPCLLFALAF